MSGGRWKAEAVLECACGARARCRVVNGGQFGHVTWSDDETPYLRRWHHKSLTDDTPMCPVCAWKLFLRTADVVDLMRLEAMLDEEFL